MKKNAITNYLVFSFLLMGVACGVTLLFHYIGFASQKSIIGMIILAVGGLSTAIAGAITSKKFHYIDSYKRIFKDFFHIKQPLKFYAIVLLFFVLSFGVPIIFGQFKSDIMWYSFFQFFLVSILFGGVEEIGWRYTFQPILEKKLPFWLASVITFASWGIWHIMYFVIDGSIGIVNWLPFFLGLLGSSFILGAIYHISKSLWLCVFFHALLNAFTQILVPTQNLITDMVLLVVKVAVSIILVMLFGLEEKRDKATLKSN